MSDKEAVLQAVHQMSDNATLDDIARRIEFLAAIQKGLDQVKRGEVVPHEQVKKELASWLSR
jgi:predicted transcriptional regulator